MTLQDSQKIIAERYMLSKMSDSEIEARRQLIKEKRPELLPKFEADVAKYAHAPATAVVSHSGDVIKGMISEYAQTKNLPHDPASVDKVYDSTMQVALDSATRAERVPFPESPSIETVSRWILNVFGPSLYGAFLALGGLGGLGSVVAAAKTAAASDYQSYMEV